MADRKQDFLGNVIGRITELPGAKGLMDSVQRLGDRLDDMQKRVRGLERMEKRLQDLEKRVKALESAGSSAGTGTRARSTTAKKATSTKSSGASTTRTAAKKPPSP